LNERDKPRHETDYPSIHFVTRLSIGVWELVSSILPANRWLLSVKAFLKLIRPGRVLMIVTLTWVSASVAKVSMPGQWIISFAGMFLAMAGFALDIYTDRKTDKESLRSWPVNPISAGMMTEKAAKRWIVVFLAVGLALSITANPLTLVPASLLLLIYLGLSVGILDGPFGRAITLGLLQALYVLLAAAATGTISGLMIWVALVFFTAMVGARAVADIRDLPNDLQTETRSLPKVFGVRLTSFILPIFITISFIISLHIYTFGTFDKNYLVCTLLSFGPGVVLAWSFPFRPTPNYAFILIGPYFGIGILYMLALLLGIS